MNKQFEHQLINCKQQIDYLGQRSQLVSQLENELQIYKLKVQENSQSIEQFNDLSKKYAEMKFSIMEKEDNISELTRKYNSKNVRLQELEEKLISMEVELERKNVQIE